MQYKIKNFPFACSYFRYHKTVFSKLDRVFEQLLPGQITVALMQIVPAAHSARCGHTKGMTLRYTMIRKLQHIIFLQRSRRAPCPVIRLHLPVSLNHHRQYITTNTGGHRLDHAHYRIRRNGRINGRAAECKHALSGFGGIRITGGNGPFGSNTRFH